MPGAGSLTPFGLAERSDRRRSETTAQIGMIAFLASWAMLFSGLFFAFGMVRMRSAEWPPPGVPVIGLLKPAVNSLLLLLSSVALTVGVRDVRRGSGRRLAWMLLATVGGGLGFVLLQIDLWAEMWRAGLRPGTGQYGGLFYALTWVHAAHVAVGLAALAWLTVRAFGGRYSPERHLAVRLWSHYWHFVGVVWMAMFLMLFVA